MAAFSSGLARVMVATDIAARGIHIDAIDLVIHADPPTEHKAYVHRSGRTARGGADGVVVTLQTKAQARDVTAMMRKADITPHAAVAVDSDSDVLAEIAGPPAPRVSVSGKVSELVAPEDRLARNDQPGVGKPWEGRPRRDRNGDSGRGRKPRDDRFRDRGPRDFAHRDERPARADQDRPRRFEGDGRRPALTTATALTRATGMSASTGATAGPTTVGPTTAGPTTGSPLTAVPAAGTTAIARAARTTGATGAAMTGGRTPAAGRRRVTVRLARPGGHRARAARPAAATGTAMTRAGTTGTAASGPRRRPSVP